MVDETHSLQPMQMKKFENDLGASMLHLLFHPLFGKKEGTGKLAKIQECFAKPVITHEMVVLGPTSWLSPTSLGLL
jgi:hypothetical protein